MNGAIEGAGWAVLWQAWDMFLHFFLLSFMAVGGAMTVAPDMQRYLVAETGWLSPGDFNNAIALAQSAPGPNVIFIPLLGWQVAMQSTYVTTLTQTHAWMIWPIAIASALMVLFAIMLPSSLLTYKFASWANHRQEHLGIKAFKAGLTPVVIALLASTAWLIASQVPEAPVAWLPAVMSVATAIMVWRTRVHLLWLIGCGAAIGAMGWV